jgi:hypothetical protein
MAVRWHKRALQLRHHRRIAAWLALVAGALGALAFGVGAADRAQDLRAVRDEIAKLRRRIAELETKIR